MKKLMITAILAAAVSFAAPAVISHAETTAGYSSVLSYGMQSSEVTELQRDLKTLGYFGYTPTGYFGSLTKESVMKFQAANNLAADGVVGPRTEWEIIADKVLQKARQLIGVPYVWGGTTPSGFDCSGFTQYVFQQNGISLPRTAELQYNEGRIISKDQLRPGDLVFFTTYKPGPSHVGIYQGNGQFIHASSGADKITVSSMDNSYYIQRYIGARRVIL